MYGPDGRIERRVAMPSALTVMHVGREFVTGVVRDSLDVQHVAVYRLERPNGIADQESRL